MFWIGSYSDGACGRPASSAIWPSESLFRSLMPKYVFAAALIPYDWLP